MSVPVLLAKPSDSLLNIFNTSSLKHRASTTQSTVLQREHVAVVRGLAGYLQYQHSQWSVSTTWLFVGWGVSSTKNDQKSVRNTRRKDYHLLKRFA